MWEEVDPSTADALRDVDAEFRKKEEMVAALHARVEDERLSQEAGLRDFRARQQQQGGAYGQVQHNSAYGGVAPAAAPHGGGGSGGGPHMLRVSMARGGGAHGDGGGLGMY